MASSNPTSRASSPRSVTSEKFERFQDRMQIDHLLKEVNLDRQALLQILKENPVAMNDLDATAIQSIVQRATKTKESEQRIPSNPFEEFAAPDMMHNESQIANRHDSDSDNDNEAAHNQSVENQQPTQRSHYGSIRNEFRNLRNSMNNLQRKIKLECYLSDMEHKKQHSERLQTLQQLTQRKKEMMVECEATEQRCKHEKQMYERQLQEISQCIKSEENEQQNLLIKKIALQQNVSRSGDKLSELLVEKKRFAEMKDISQFAPIAVFYVLKYVEITDFVSCILCCRAWYFSLNKPCYWRILQRNIIYQSKQLIHMHIANKHFNHERDELVASGTKLKRINHAVMKLKIEPKEEASKAALKKKKSKRMLPQVSTPKPDDIYQQCMQQLQKVIAQSEQDRDELEERVRAQTAILKFMQTSMFGKMHELAELRVRKWVLSERMQNEYSIQKRELALRIRDLENELNANRLLIERMKDEFIKAQENRMKRLKTKQDLGELESGTMHISMNNELKKLKQHTKKLAQVIVQIRKEIPKRKQEVKKYQSRVDLLHSQYQQITHQPLP
eukprot:CAMPEP_0197039376 /NCGR_PEP_ID=MMETSP1384-20130603/16166_1 /TAXON_ID=29189 /ORGANISM="Ammonia sp." /LENGTH=559 /DNA_ID=CAMNT_0042469961 /DNA_START=29 /DNA_END=1708 /DNA_ORIENTATION=-